jgi:hypothetical protein
VSVCANFQPDRPIRLAAYSEQHNTTQHRTEAIVEKYNILEPVSVGGWTKIRLRRITRSSTCVCLRIRNYFVLLCATRDMRAARDPHSNFALAAVAAPCSIPVHSRVALVLALRARAGRLCRPDCAHADPITCAHCPNGFLYQFGGQSVQPVWRLGGMCGAARTFAFSARSALPFGRL